MSITPMWPVDRDGSMFTDKKAAEGHVSLFSDSLPDRQFVAHGFHR
ncbi:hypothetical protein [Endozoicomonas sp. ONNA2]|nr:hypothetical protein [Endozoicomonas sp. ONNA2]